MPKLPLLYCATDSEIYDLLMSSKQRMTEDVLLWVARQKGIFYSPRESREDLVSNLSLLPYGYADLDAILDHRATVQRTEKRTSIALRQSLNLEDIKSVCVDYKECAASDEKITVLQEGTAKYTATIHYSELDYSKTRLLQRRNKEADIEFFISDNETIVRMPANEKAREVVGKLKNALDARLKADIAAEAIEITHLRTPEARTLFFTSLISQILGYRLDNVTDVKVESKLTTGGQIEEGDEENGDETAEAADSASTVEKQQMLSIVENVALKGSLLLSSPEYQQLKQKGFYITNVVWRSRQVESPYNVVEFEAGFDEPREGKGFKYNVRGVFRYVNGRYTVTPRQIPKEERPPYFALIEQTARAVLGNVTDELATKAVAEES